MPIDTPAYRWGKKAFDRVFALMTLIVISPVMTVIAVCVWLSTGNVIYRQIRIGYNGRRFNLLKFQTMRESHDHEVRWTLPGDERITQLGRFLRATSLDELPQLVNVLRGEMSIVGPRPERPHFVEQFSSQYPAYSARHIGDVGITGLAQIEGLRGDTSIEQRVQRDLHYLSHWSFSEDIRIIAKTIPVVLKRSGY